MFKISIIFIVLFSAAFNIEAGNFKKLQQRVKNSKDSDNLKHAQWSVFARYVETGEVVINLEGEKSVAPASGLKVFTAATALDVFGPESRFETKLYFKGKLSREGILTGDIVIRGDGDPTLGSNRIDGSLPVDSLMMSWVEAIKESGIKKIEGAILADASLFTGWPVESKWYFEDIGNYYGAGVSGLCINENLYHLYFQPGKRVGSPAKVIRTKPAIAGLNFKNFVSTGKRGSGDNAYIFNVPGNYQPTIRGTIPAGVEEFSIKGSMPDPPLVVGQLLKKELLESGIHVSNEVRVVSVRPNYTAMQQIHSTFSPPLSEIVYWLNKRSINLYAEQLAIRAAIEDGFSGKVSSGLKMIQKFLEKLEINTDVLNLYDASGLSRSDVISAKMMVDLLGKMTKHPHFKPFYDSLPVAGDPDDEGSLSRFGDGTELAHNARLKTGLIVGVRSHSGYVKDKSGRLIAVSLIANNYRGGARQIDRIHEAVMLELAKLK